MGEVGHVVGDVGGEDLVQPVQDGVVRPGLTVTDLLALASAVALAGATADHAQQLLEIMRHGIASERCTPPQNSFPVRLVHGEPGAAYDGDPAGGDESVESRGEEHMRQAENADAEAAGQPAEGTGDRRGAHEDG